MILQHFYFIYLTSNIEYSIIFPKCIREANPIPDRDYPTKKLTNMVNPEDKTKIKMD